MKDREGDNKNMKEIYLDMDGTFVDFYGVENWLDCLINEDIKPYAEAKPLCRLNVLARLLNNLQKKGYTINIVTWLCKNCKPLYGEQIKIAKQKWLKTHLKTVNFNNIFMLEYGTPKTNCGCGYLFDDEKNNRTEWINKGGVAYDETELINQLKNLLKAD